MASSSVDTMRPFISPAELSALGPPLAGARESISSMKITDGAAARAAANTPCALRSLQGVLGARASSSMHAFAHADLSCSCTDSPGCTPYPQRMHDTG